MNPRSEEETKRAEAFMKDYGELVAKHQMDIASFPVLIPDGQGAFKLTIQSTPVDTSKAPKLSPFMGKENV